MRTLPLLTLCVSAVALTTVLSAAPVPKDLGKKDDAPGAGSAPRMPLWIIAGGQMTLTNFQPSVQIGSLDPKIEFKRLTITDDQTCCHNSQPLVRGTIWEQFASGQEKLQPAQRGRSVVAVVTGPSLNSGEYYGPARLTRSGKIITLDLETWKDNGPRLRNVPSQRVYALDLGELETGVYELQVVQRGMFCDAAKGHVFYRLSTLAQGAGKFEVYDKPGADAKELVLTAFENVDVPEKAAQSAWQRPLSWQRDVDLAGNLNALPAPGLRVGTFNLLGWLGGKTIEVPALQLPKKGDAFYATILGPTLDTGMWMTLRDIEWRDKTAKLRVDVWRDSGARLQNLKHSPLLVVPIYAAHAALVPAGEYKVEVEWTWLIAPTSRGLYTAQETPESYRFLEKRSQDTVVIK